MHQRPRKLSKVCARARLTKETHASHLCRDAQMVSWRPSRRQHARPVTAAVQRRSALIQLAWDPDAPPQTDDETRPSGKGGAKKLPEQKAFVTLRAPAPGECMSSWDYTTGSLRVLPHTDDITRYTTRRLVDVINAHGCTTEDPLIFYVPQDAYAGFTYVSFGHGAHATDGGRNVEACVHFLLANTYRQHGCLFIFEDRAHVPGGADTDWKKIGDYLFFYRRAGVAPEPMMVGAPAGRGRGRGVRGRPRGRPRGSGRGARGGGGSAAGGAVGPDEDAPPEDSAAPSCNTANMSVETYLTHALIRESSIGFGLSRRTELKMPVDKGVPDGTRGFRDDDSGLGQQVKSWRGLVRFCGEQSVRQLCNSMNPSDTFGYSFSDEQGGDLEPAEETRRLREEARAQFNVPNVSVRIFSAKCAARAREAARARILGIPCANDADSLAAEVERLTRHGYSRTCDTWFGPPADPTEADGQDTGRCVTRIGRSKAHPLILATFARSECTPPIDRRSPVYLDVWRKHNQTARFTSVTNNVAMPSDAFYDYYLRYHGTTTATMDGDNVELIINDMRKAASKDIPRILRDKRGSLSVYHARNVERLRRALSVHSFMPAGLDDAIKFLDRHTAMGETSGNLVGGGLRLAGSLSAFSEWMGTFMANAAVSHKIIHLHLLELLLWLLSVNSAYDPMSDSVLVPRALLAGTPQCGKSFIIQQLSELLVAVRRVDHKTFKADTTDENQRGLNVFADEADAQLYATAFKNMYELLSSVRNSLQVRATSDFRQDLLASVTTQIRLRVEGCDILKPVEGGKSTRAAQVTEAVKAASVIETCNWPPSAMAARLIRRIWNLDVDEAPPDGAHPSSFDSNMVSHAGIRKEISSFVGEWAKKVRARACRVVGHCRVD
jgi:hypothetical protein